MAAHLPNPLNFSWTHATDTTKSNLEKLSTVLANNQHFEVEMNDQNEKILKIVDNSTVFSKIKYFFQKEEKNREVKELVRSSIVELAEQLPDVITEDNQTLVREFFFKRLAVLPQEIFDRKVLGLVDEDHKKILPKILNPNLDKEVDAYASATERKLERRIEKTRLGFQLGYNLKPISAGASGSYFAYDHKMKIIGVFKPGQEESTSTNTPKLIHRIANSIKAFLSIESHRTFWPGSGYISEVMSSALAEHMDLDVVPRSDIVKLTSDQFESAKRTGAATEEHGSFQIFASETQSADEAFNLNSMGRAFGNVRLKFNTWLYKDVITQKISQSDFEMMAVMDGLILNRDRHFENWLVKTEATTIDPNEIDPDAPKFHKIALIDHQMGFPVVNPSIDDSGYRRQQNKWAILPMADKPFTEEMKDKTAERLRGANLQNLLDSLQAASEKARVSNPQAPLFNEVNITFDSQEFAFKQRVAVLLVAQSKIPSLTIRQHAEIKSLDEMIAATSDTIDITNLVSLNAYLGLAH